MCNENHYLRSVLKSFINQFFIIPDECKIGIMRQ